MDYEVIDHGRLLVIVRIARQTNNYRIDELGKCVSNIVKIVLNSDKFWGYTDDWKCEMFGDACLAIYNSMENVELDSSTSPSFLFNYFYTIALNSCKKTLKKLKKVDLSIEEGNAETLEPFYLRNKRRIVKGCLKNNEEKILECAKIKKMVLLKNAVGRAVSEALNHMRKYQLEQLIRIAKSNRENLCKTKNSSSRRKTLPNGNRQKAR